MADLDELSRTIGKIEGTIKAMAKKQERLCDKVDKIDDALTNHRVKIAAMAGGVSAIVSYFVSILV